MTATETHMKPAPLAVRLQSMLVDHGGAVTRADLIGYLAELFGSDRDHVRDVLLEEAAAGTIVLASAPPHGVTVALPWAAE